MKWGKAKHEEEMEWVWIDVVNGMSRFQENREAFFIAKTIGDCNANMWTGWSSPPYIICDALPLLLFESEPCLLLLYCDAWTISQWMTYDALWSTSWKRMRNCGGFYFLLYQKKQVVPHPLLKKYNCLPWHGLHWQSFATTNACIQWRYVQQTVVELMWILHSFAGSSCSVEKKTSSSCMFL